MKNGLYKNEYIICVLLFVTALLLVSCSSGKTGIPEESVDTFWLKQQPLPYQVAEKWMQDYEEISLLDVPNYSEAPQLFMHLLPLLHREGFLYLDLWFLPAEFRPVFQEIIDAESFERDNTLNELKKISAYHLQERYLSLLKYLWDFQQTLEVDEESFHFERKEDDKTFHFIMDQSDQQGPLMLLYSNDCPWPYELPNHPVNILEQKDEIICLEHKEESTPPVALVLWKHPEEFTPTPPLVKEINKEDIPGILKDFPNQKLEKPLFLALWKVRGRLKKDFKREMP